RRAAVSAFGFSGTNVHLVLEEAPSPAPRATPSERAELVFLSAKDAETLRARAGELARWLTRQGSRVSLQDVAYTANQRRTHFARRLAIVAADTSELASKLERAAAADEAPGLFVGSGRELPKSARRAAAPAAAHPRGALLREPFAERAERVGAPAWRYGEGHQ